MIQSLEALKSKESIKKNTKKTFFVRHIVTKHFAEMIVQRKKFSLMTVMMPKNPQLFATAYLLNNAFIYM